MALIEPQPRRKEAELKVVTAIGHGLLRSATREMLHQNGVRLVGEAQDGPETLRLARALAPDAIVLDLSLPPTNGLEAARLVKAACPASKLILLVDEEAARYNQVASQHGIDYCVPKTSLSRELSVALGLEGRERA